VSSAPSSPPFFDFTTDWERHGESVDTGVVWMASKEPPSNPVIVDVGSGRFVPGRDREAFSGRLSFSSDPRDEIWCVAVAINVEGKNCLRDGAWLLSIGGAGQVLVTKSSEKEEI
jgi:hypothetical protein